MFVLLSACTKDELRSKPSTSNEPVIRVVADELYETRFRNYVPPSVPAVKLRAFSREFRSTTFDQVWKSAISIMMQKGALAYVSKDDGLIVRFGGDPVVRGRPQLKQVKVWLKSGYPMVLHVERNTNTRVVVSANWMPHYFERIDDRNLRAINIKASRKRLLANRFFDELAVQVFASAKWKRVLN